MNFKNKGGINMANKMTKSLAEPNSIGEMGMKVGGAVAGAALSAVAGWGVAKFLEWNDERRAKKKTKKKEEAKRSLSDEEILKLAADILERQEKEKSSGKTGDLTAQ